MQPSNTSLASDTSVKDYAWLKLVRIISTILIVMAHFDVGWGGGAMWTENLYYTITRMGVPLFFMSTGHLLLSQREDILSFMKKHLLPLLVSFFFWSSLYDLYSNDVFHKGTNLQDILKMFLHILHTPRIGYFWFFYSLIGLYIFIPVLRLIVDSNSKKVLNYYVVLWLLSFAIAPMVRTIAGLEYGLEAPLVQRYLGYFLLGYMLGQAQNTRWSLLIALGIFLLSFLFTFTVFHFNLPPTDNEDFFRSYMSFNIICMSVSLFSILGWIGKFLPASLHGICEWLDQTTFGVYLTHPVIMGWMVSVALLVGLKLHYKTALIVPVVSFAAFFASALFTAILRKIPIIRYTVPQLGD